MNTKLRQRHRITTAEVQHSGRQFILTFEEAGLRVHEKHQPTKYDRLITPAELIGGAAPAGAKVNPDYASGSASEALDLAACDLACLADSLHSNNAVNKATVSAVKESVLTALKVIRSLDTLADMFTRK